MQAALAASAATDPEAWHGICHEMPRVDGSESFRPRKQKKRNGRTEGALENHELP
jgi:hypothetical protein